MKINSWLVVVPGQKFSNATTSLELIFWEGPARKHAPGHKLQALKEQATS